MSALCGRSSRGADKAPPAAKERAPKQRAEPRRRRVHAENRDATDVAPAQASLPLGAMRRTRRRVEGDDDIPVVGMGDHVPMFLLRPVKLKPSKQAETKEDLDEIPQTG